MCRKRRAQAVIVVLLIAAFSRFAPIAKAGRKVPDPVLSLFEQGYGIVAAEVTDAKLLAADGEDPPVYDCYDCTFKVHEIVAQPIKVEAFSFHRGDSINIRIYAGYGCQIEDDPKTALAKGKLYYLTVRKSSNGTIEHAQGASALTAVEKFEASDIPYYARIRSLAAEPDDRKLMAWVEVVKNPAESDRLRADALAGVLTWLWPDAGPATNTAPARASLHKLWNDPQSHLSVALLDQLDGVLQLTDRSFKGSDERCDVWLKNLLTLTPERKKEASRLDNLASGVLRDLAKTHPDATGEQCAKQLLNKEWPRFYRQAIAVGLITAYGHAVRADPTWEAAIHAYFIELMNNGDPFPIRVGAGVLENFSSAGVTRSYRPDAKVKAAMRSAVNRLTTASAQPGADHEFGEAAHELARVLRSMDAPHKP